MRRRNGSRRQQCELEKVASVERQPRNLLWVDQGSERGGVPVDRDEWRDHVDVLLHRNGQWDVEPQVLSHCQLRLTRIRPITGQFDGEAVLADFELGQ